MQILNDILRAYQKWYINYSGLFDEEREDDLPFFRDKLFLSILSLSIVLGAIAYIPSVIFALLNGDYYIFIVDTLGILLLYFIAFNKSVALHVKKNIFAGIFYFIAFTLLVFIGLQGNGAIVVFTPNILVTLYSGRRSGLYSVGLTALIYCVFLVCSYFQLVDLPIFSHNDFNLMFIVFVNNIIFTLFIVFSISYLIDMLYASLLKQNKLREELNEEHKNLLVAKEKADESDRLKTAFLANMSHEIKTPMYGILGSVDILKNYNTEDAEYQEYLKAIETTSLRLADVISDVVNVSKIETGLMTINTQTFNIQDAINEVLKPFVFVSERKNIEIKKNITTSYNASLAYTDRDKLETILRHILQNAFKFTNKGFVEIGCSKPDKTFFEFYVKDSGIGIAMEDIQTVFQPFFQVDAEHKKALHGSGLGLSLAKSYVEMLGGEINIESKENGGTTVWFTVYSDFESIK
ncbi:ATP-binding protein [Tamlana crocina]|uniref:histidine kinase n=1 Tax=Tamlana crocina TaxID=393006 RepID=A0ABX1DBE3_9FLAO|nr:ATP-binding protein [Tamlana crocina]NJX14358.1 two-component sensor histidine kinase [Tamlana crocina]